MPGVNRTIVASTVIIMAGGLYHYFTTGGSLTSPDKTNTTLVRIVVGAYMLALIVSLFDLFGFGIGQIAAYVMLLAVGTTLLVVVPDLMSRFNTQNAKGA